MNALPLTMARIAVIGGGPAGLMAAERLAARGARITVYDHMPTVGRKFLMAGRGGLNLTHSEPLDLFMTRYGAAAEWLSPAIAAFPPEAVRDWCRGLGRETFIGSSGRIFPKEMKASPLLRAWLRRLESLGVQFALRQGWQGWNENGELLFTDAERKNITMQADAVILALGGASWPRLGSNGDWVDILRAQGVTVKPLRPANCGFIAPWSHFFGERFAGRPLKPVTISLGGQNLQGEIMITRQGVEGGVIYALSSVLRAAIDATGSAVINVDLRPGLTMAQLIERLKAPRGSQSSATYLRKAAGLSPAAIGLMRESLEGRPLPEDSVSLARLIKATPVKLTATASIERAISSAGGIARDEVDASFMLKKKPGIFVAGEMLDWEAPTGGYLLQASFSTAVAAAIGVENYLLDS